MKSVILIIIASCLSLFIYKYLWGKPLSFNHFILRCFIKEALSDPEKLSSLGLIENSYLDFHSGKLTDISFKANKKKLEEIKNQLTILHSYNRDKLSKQEKITYDMFEDYLNNYLKLASFNYGSLLDFYPYPINQFESVPNLLPEFMVNYHQIVDKKSAKRFISRLSKFNIKFDQLIKETELREKEGIILPRFLIDKVLEQAHKFIEQGPKENMLYINFKKKFKSNELDDELASAITNKVYPSYLRLIEFLEKEKTIATDDAGVWKLPNGDDFYAFVLKIETTTDYTPEQIHEIGLREVSRISGEMRQTLDKLGYSRDKSVAILLQELLKDQRFLYPDSSEGRAKALADFHLIFDSIKDKMTKLFLTFPKAELKIEEIPAFKAAASPVAYYNLPTLNGSLPGIFFVNTHDIKNLPKFNMPTLAYHEGIPGHHFQIALAQEIKDLPLFRRVTFCNSYAEGWALYSEQLAWEEGFTTDPYCNLGRLQMEMLRAARLVIDTGLHYKRWSREKAITYMSETTGLNESDIIAEVDRYIVWPGQACSYKIGMLKILELREKMKNKLGKEFDIRQFHDIILKNGALPLWLLEKQIDF